MYRKYIEDLEKWLVNPYRKPLIVWGARQVGKSYLIKNIFAEKHFKKKYIYVDCRVNQRFVNYCEDHLNVDDILNYLSLEHDMIVDKNTLLIFDEAQECLPLITLLKYFCQEHKEIPVIATGSMVRIKIQRENRKRGRSEKNKYLFPVGKINQLTIYPMNFGEFLINKNKVLYDKIVESYTNKLPLENIYHEKAMDLFYSFLLVGGMPEAVNAYLETDNYQVSREILKDLYDNYLSDMELYQASPEAIIRSKKIFENIYSQLNKESKNFKSSLVEEQAKTRDLRTPIDWLTLAFIVSKSSLIKETVTIPLIESDDSLFRLYLSDIGMFSYQSGINTTTFIDKNSRNTLSGIFYENYVANEIVSSNNKLFYWKGKANAEFEFLLEKDSYVIPIDVKSSRGSLNSLEKYKSHNKLNYAVKISTNNYGYDEKKRILTIPFYEVFLLLKEFNSTKYED